MPLCPVCQYAELCHPEELPAYLLRCNKCGVLQDTCPSFCNLMRKWEQQSSNQKSRRLSSRKLALGWIYCAYYKNRITHPKISLEALFTAFQSVNLPHVSLLQLKTDVSCFLQQFYPDITPSSLDLSTKPISLQEHN